MLQPQHPDLQKAKAWTGRMQKHSLKSKFEIMYKECKSIAADEMHPHVLRELMDEVSKPLFIIFEKLCQPCEVSTDWKRRKVTLIFKKGKKEDVGN